MLFLCVSRLKPLFSFSRRLIRPMAVIFVRFDWTHLLCCFVIGPASCYWVQSKPVKLTQPYLLPRSSFLKVRARERTCRVPTASSGHHLRTWGAKGVHSASHLCGGEGASDAWVFFLDDDGRCGVSDEGVSRLFDWCGASKAEVNLFLFLFLSLICARCIRFPVRIQNVPHCSDSPLFPIPPQARDWNFGSTTASMIYPWSRRHGTTQAIARWDRMGEHKMMTKRSWDSFTSTTSWCLCVSVAF